MGKMKIWVLIVVFTSVLFAADPLVNLTYPESGNFNGNTITWSASDADNDDLAFDLYYDYDNDPDNGKNLIADNLDLSYCIGSPDTGVNCSYDWASKISGSYYIHVICRDLQDSDLVIDYENMIAYHDPIYELTYNGTRKTFMEHLLDESDQITLMSYYDTSGTIIAVSEAEISYGEQLNKPVVLGVETNDIASIVNTFYDENETYMETVLDDVRDEYSSNSSFKGFAIHYYRAYDSWDENLTVTENTTRTMWVWRTNEIMGNENETQKLINFSKMKDVDILYIYIGSDLTVNKVLWENFITRLHSEGFIVYLMADDIGYATNNQQGLDVFEQVLALDEEVEGFTLDLETILHPDWEDGEPADSGSNLEITTGLLNLVHELQKMKITQSEAIDTSGLIRLGVDGDSGSRPQLKMTSHVDGVVLYVNVSEPGAVVRLVLEEPYEGLLEMKTTDEKGNVNFTLAKQGFYEVYAKKSGYRPASSSFEFYYPEESLENESEQPTETIEEPECRENADCKQTEYCAEGECKPVTGKCGYAKNHAWTNYECCGDGDCNQLEVCINNACVQEKLPEEEPVVNQTDETIQNKTAYEPPETEEQKGCVLPALILSGLVFAILKR